jgi:hypothetical protein
MLCLVCKFFTKGLESMNLELYLKSFGNIRKYGDDGGKQPLVSANWVVAAAPLELGSFEVQQ